MKSLDKVDHQDQEIEVEIEIVEIVEEVVVMDIVEVLVGPQVEMDIEEIIPPTEIIQEIDTIDIVIEEIVIDIIEIDQDHQVDMILEDIKVEVIQDQDIQEIEDNHPRNAFFCDRTGHPIEYCWDFQKYLEKIGKQLSKIKDGQPSKKKSDEESSDKEFVVKSVSSLLENLGLGIESTNC